MQDDASHTDRGRLLLPAVLVAAFAALALWAGVALGSGDPAGAATVTPAVDTRPVQQQEPADPPERGARGDCPEHDGGGASSAPQSAAPDASATPDV
jgi:hypothetical protein